MKFALPVTSYVKPPRNWKSFLSRMSLWNPASNTPALPMPRSSFTDCGAPVEIDTVVSWMYGGAVTPQSRSYRRPKFTVRRGAAFHVSPIHADQYGRGMFRLKLPHPSLYGQLPRCAMPSPPVCA